MSCGSRAATLATRVIGTNAPRELLSRSKGAIVMTRIGGDVEDVIRNANDQIKRAMQSVADKLGESGEYAYEQGSDYVEEHPWRVVLTAAILGFGLGVVTTMASRQPPQNRLQRLYDRYTG
jgi:ElaB/YqjD/DUF883 family membrane-anchored ribosome-binding protein